MKWIALMLVVAVIGSTGCTSRPVYNVEKQAVVTTHKAATMQDVESAIVKAGIDLGWVMTPVHPGLVTGRLTLRTHVAVVDVVYDTQTFSIQYKDSVNLDYSSGNIHKNYNGWIENLERGIRTNLAML
jgi:hypothetical protein